MEASQLPHWSHVKLGAVACVIDGWVPLTHLLNGLILKIISFSERDIIRYSTRNLVMHLELIPASFDSRLLTFCTQVFSPTYDSYAMQYSILFVFHEQTC